MRPEPPTTHPPPNWRRQFHTCSHPLPDYRSWASRFAVQTRAPLRPRRFSADRRLSRRRDVFGTSLKQLEGGFAGVLGRARRFWGRKRRANTRPNPLKIAAVKLATEKSRKIAAAKNPAPKSSGSSGPFHRALHRRRAKRACLPPYFRKSRISPKKIGRASLCGPNHPQPTRLQTGGVGFAPVRAPRPIIGHGPAVLRFKRARRYARVVFRPIAGCPSVGTSSGPR